MSRNHMDIVLCFGAGIVSAVKHAHLIVYITTLLIIY